jgi:hypothetical protein
MRTLFSLVLTTSVISLLATPMPGAVYASQPATAPAPAVPYELRQMQYDNNGAIVNHTIRVFPGEDQRAVPAKKGEMVTITELKRRERLPGDLDTRNMTNDQIKAKLAEVSLGKGHISTRNLRNIFK